MTTLLEIEDELNDCLRRVEGIYMAAAGVSDRKEANALQRLVLDLLVHLEPARDAIDNIRTGTEGAFLEAIDRIGEAPEATR